MLYIRQHYHKPLSIGDVAVSILESIVGRYAYSKDKKVKGMKRCALKRSHIATARAHSSFQSIKTR